LIWAKPPSWKALLGNKGMHSRKELPLHVKPEVIGGFNIEALLRLQMPTKQRETLLKAKRWVEPSDCYDAIAARLHQIERAHVTRMAKRHLVRLYDVGKLVDGTSIVAYCNSYEVPEERDEGDRVRPIMEPLINDLFSTNPQDLLYTTTSYTSRDIIRKGVMMYECAVQYDFSAWFDQIPIHAQVRKYFGVGVDKVLAVLPMGFRPSCEVAEACTDALSNITTFLETPHTQATCVDNVLYQGDRATVTRAAEIFLNRCAKTGAKVKDPICRVCTTYDFLGEKYDHEKGTRALTSKTAVKCRLAAYVMATRQTLSPRQVMAIVGLLLYAASTLRIVVGRFHHAMRFLAVCAKSHIDEKIYVPVEVRNQLKDWANIGATNEPTIAHRGDIEIDATIYTDASALGWGAISVDKEGSVLQISRRWLPNEMMAWNLLSSVEAEPLAVCKAIAAFVTPKMRKVLILTDHQPLVFCAKKTFGRAAAYSHMCEFLSCFADMEFDFQHIAGAINPADYLSRNFAPPPILSVTHIGCRAIQSL
jgi:hypothetical protein